LETTHWNQHIGTHALEPTHWNQRVGDNAFAEPDMGLVAAVIVIGHCSCGIRRITRCKGEIDKGWTRGIDYLCLLNSRETDITLVTSAASHAFWLVLVVVDD
jgi:hypothetical protein